MPYLSKVAGEIQDFPLGISGFQFSHLYNPLRLRDLHAEFWRQTNTAAPGLQERFQGLETSGLNAPKRSETLIELARHVGDFLARLFQISGEVARIKNATFELNPIFRLKNEFLKIRVFKRLDEPAPAPSHPGLERLVGDILNQEPGGTDPELRFARATLFLLDCEKKLKKEPLSLAEHQRAVGFCSPISGGALEDKITAALAALENWCVQQYRDPMGHTSFAQWVSFVRPGKRDFDNLVPTEAAAPDLPSHRVVNRLFSRDGFKLTDPRMSTKRILREVDYCLYCHQREKDSCAKGFPEKNGQYKKNPLGITLHGCPLDERISEMHLLRKEGELVASLAVIMLDNPMCPGTGHRICNDCMKGCIFQKQDPVNIPENETGILTETLNLPYGFEIYSLLTRFNPLNRARPYALPYNGNDILVVGLGPAGYTLSHYLANDGFGVVGIEGLKLEPVDDSLTGRGRPFPKPIRSYCEITKELDQRTVTGFGGVSEYGITVRWDKNFLTVIYLTLLRRHNIRFYGGIRFGGTLTLDDAWGLGFKHVAVATGAGRPTLIEMKNNLARGVRKASDFLMSLQLGGAFKKNSLSNLQVRLPAVVIGGGLTALDTATETLAYYPVQVEKTLAEFEILCRDGGEASVWGLCEEEEREVLGTFLDHGRAVREERQRAEREKRPPAFARLCRQWGGVNVAYRKRLVDSPAYRLNHEEVMKAFEEGIGFIENVTPREVLKDRFGGVDGLQCLNADGTQVRLPARSIAVAAGTAPNTIYEKEFPGTFKMDSKGMFFKRFRLEPQPGGQWEKVPAAPHEKEAFFSSYENQGRYVSFYGDNHPEYAGNVVKAMASAKHGAPQIARLFASDIEQVRSGGLAEATMARFQTLTRRLDTALIPHVVRVNRLTPSIVEVVVQGHYAAAKFKPGQFYRLQNYENEVHSVDGYRLSMEGIALTGAWVDQEKDLLGLVVLEMGASSKMCALLRPGDPVVVMGPTGAPSEIPEGETVLLAGGGLGNAVLLSISQALRAKGCKVIYFAGYKEAKDVFLQEKIESATDQMVWSVDAGPLITPNRPQDLSFEGNIVEAMVAYAKGKLQKQPLVPFSLVDRILVIGSDRMMAAVGAARLSVLKPHLRPDHIALASINSPMQCMMKEVCAQCLQRQVDPKTGEERFVFSCFNQDQEIDKVDFANLSDRLRTNSLSEKLTASLVDCFLSRSKADRV